MVLTKNKNWNNFFYNFDVYNFVKWLLIITITFIIALLIYLISVYWLVVKQTNSSMVFNTFKNFNQISINLTFSPLKNFSLDFLGLIMTLLAFIVGLLSFFALDSRFYYKNTRFVLMCNILCLVIYVFTSTNDIIVFFISYELLLIPSFLFVYFVSPYKRSIQASIYFLIWTQIGSLLVLIGIVYIISLTGSSSFTDLQDFNFSGHEMIILFFLFFLGFGIKIPIWPFHHWLTKTHVEAPAGFSMFLSGFLVKSALYGFYKVTFNLGGEISTIIVSIFVIIGAIDASIKMWSQTDLKKLIAFATIQEMNMIFLLFCFGDSIAFWGGILFCITHAFLSSLLFYTVDCIQRRYNTRSVVELSGILNTTPNLGIIIFLNTLFYSGLPGTLKFTSELFLYLGLYEHSPLVLLLLIFGVNFLGLIGFCKNWYNVLFGMTCSKSKAIPNDLTIKDSLIIGVCYLGLIGFNYLTILIFN